MESVQTFGRKKTAVAVAFVKRGVGRVKVNGVPIELVQPEALRFKVWEPILLLGAQRYSEVDIRIRVKGGGYTSQLYAIRQAIAKGLVAWYQKYVDEASKREIKEILTTYDLSLIHISEPTRLLSISYAVFCLKKKKKKKNPRLKHAFKKKITHRQKRKKMIL
eukprot:TRINITY_DN786_c0_g1_i10.p1 TRINITY_DN786_c0_g1~~TRINITY_DN786_c0_g1_i10.p1  ORF type:complete len:163 (-),score=51.87 TRINITY_DN786_c0_g1_i10:39-527(-)